MGSGWIIDGVMVVVVADVFGVPRLEPAVVRQQG
jgi:hypothetical protein